MSAVKGEGIGGLSKAREHYTNSRYDYYADNTYEEEIIRRDKFFYYPQHIVDVYDNSMPIKFVVVPEVEYFTVLPSLRLHGELAVRNISQDKSPADGEIWSLVNNFINACFASCEVLINQHLISDSSKTPYPWKSAIECQHGFKSWYMDNIMVTDGYVKDTSQKMD